MYVSLYRLACEDGRAQHKSQLSANTDSNGCLSQTLSSNRSGVPALRTCNPRIQGVQEVASLLSVTAFPPHAKPHCWWLRRCFHSIRGRCTIDMWAFRASFAVSVVCIVLLHAQAGAVVLKPGKCPLGRTINSTELRYVTVY